MPVAPQKLTDKQIRRMKRLDQKLRKMYAQDCVARGIVPQNKRRHGTVARLAKMFGINRKYANAILTGRRRTKVKI